MFISDFISVLTGPVTYYLVLNISENFLKINDRRSELVTLHLPQDPPDNGHQLRIIDRIGSLAVQHDPRLSYETMRLPVMCGFALDLHCELICRSCYKAFQTSSARIPSLSSAIN